MIGIRSDGVFFGEVDIEDIKKRIGKIIVIWKNLMKPQKNMVFCKAMILLN